ncbi:DNA polymerase beta thumb [uncultured archaeon]|nr:DNA polymerase beta thumb [uncultured archaeon]
MKLKRVLKKGRILFTRKGSFVIKLANEIYNSIKPFCRKIEIAGSIKRKKINPNDIDIVLIPRNRIKIEELMSKKGKFIQGGEKKSRWKIKGVQVELYYTLPDEWGAALLAYSSTFGASIGLRVIAKRKGLKLNQHGLFRRGKKIAGRTEKEIYNALGRKWKKPENR